MKFENDEFPSLTQQNVKQHEGWSTVNRKTKKAKAESASVPWSAKPSFSKGMTKGKRKFQLKDFVVEPRRRRHTKAKNPPPMPGKAKAPEVLPVEKTAPLESPNSKPAPQVDSAPLVDSVEVPPPPANPAQLHNEEAPWTIVGRNRNKNPKVHGAQTDKSKLRPAPTLNPKVQVAPALKSKVVPPGKPKVQAAPLRKAKAVLHSTKSLSVPDSPSQDNTQKEKPQKVPKVHLTSKLLSTAASKPSNEGNLVVSETSYLEPTPDASKKTHKRNRRNLKSKNMKHSEVPPVPSNPSELFEELDVDLVPPQLMANNMTAVVINKVTNCGSPVKNQVYVGDDADMLTVTHTNDGSPFEIKARLNDKRSLKFGYDGNRTFNYIMLTTSESGRKSVAAVTEFRYGLLHWQEDKCDGTYRGKLATQQPKFVTVPKEKKQYLVLGMNGDLMDRDLRTSNEVSLCSLTQTTNPCELADVMTKMNNKLYEGCGTYPYCYKTADKVYASKYPIVNHYDNYAMVVINEPAGYKSYVNYNTKTNKCNLVAKYKATDLNYSFKIPIWKLYIPPKPSTTRRTTVAIRPTKATRAPGFPRAPKGSPTNQIGPKKDDDENSLRVVEIIVIIVLSLAGLLILLSIVVGVIVYCIRRRRRRIEISLEDIKDEFWIKLERYVIENGDKTFDVLKLDASACCKKQDDGIRTEYDVMKPELAKFVRYSTVPIRTAERLFYKSIMLAVHANTVRGDGGAFLCICISAPVDTSKFPNGFVTYDGVEYKKDKSCRGRFEFYLAGLSEGCNVIVKLCKNFELDGKKEKEKCAEYFKPKLKGVFKNGPLTTTTIAVDQYKGYTKRTLRFELKGQKPREVTHFEVTSWPDHDVPDGEVGVSAVVEILDFLRQPGVRPIIHCAAGLGRTGTVAAGAMLFNSLSSNNPCKSAVDAYAQVRQYRCRVGLDVAQILAFDRIIFEYAKRYHPKFVANEELFPAGAAERMKEYDQKIKDVKKEFEADTKMRNDALNELLNDLLKQKEAQAAKGNPATTENATTDAKGPTNTKTDANNAKPSTITNAGAKPTTKTKPPAK